MAMAREVATWSKDPKKVGAVVVSPDKRRVSWGYNGFPTGVPDNAETLAVPELKNQLMVHAEENAIGNADCSVVGWVLYVTKFPCAHCAGVIINRGIEVVVTPSYEYKGTRWGHSQVMAESMFADAGVEVIFHDT